MGVVYDHTRWCSRYPALAGWPQITNLERAGFVVLHGNGLIGQFEVVDEEAVQAAHAAALLEGSDIVGYIQRSVQERLSNFIGRPSHNRQQRAVMAATVQQQLATLNGSDSGMVADITTPEQASRGEVELSVSAVTVEGAGTGVALTFKLQP